jgi:hypothetical protein
MLTIIVGNTIDECVYLFALLDRHCHLQLLAEAAAANGIPKSIISPKDAEYTVKTTGYWEALYLNVFFLSPFLPLCSFLFQFQPEYELLVKETNGDFLQ